jgi:hypothetical protein
MNRALFAGQWAPMVGTGLAILGSLYLLLAAEVEALKKVKRSKDNSPDSREVRWTDGDIIGSPLQSPIDSCPPLELVSGRLSASSRSDARPDASYAGHDLPTERLCANCGHYHRQGQQDHRSRIPGTGTRGRIARFIVVIDAYIDSFRQGIFGDPDPDHEEPAAVIDVPGEELRNRLRRGTDGSRSHSRAPSVNRGVGVESYVDGSSNTTRRGSPQPQQSPRSPSPLPRAAAPRRSTTSKLSAIEKPFDPQDSAPSSSAAALANRGRSRQDSLQVPEMVHSSY